MRRRHGRNIPETAEELIEKHGGDLIVEMANDGNIAARCAIELAAERDPERYRTCLNQLTGPE